MLYCVHRRERGQALVEFAMLFPVILLLALGIFEFGRAFYSYSTIANAAREGTRYGVTKPTDNSGIQSAGINKAIALGLVASNFKVECLDNLNNIGTTNCYFDNRIRVTVNYTFTTVTPLVPSFNMSSAATMRIEAP